jgi:hypothetical protein
MWGLLFLTLQKFLPLSEMEEEKERHAERNSAYVANLRLLAQIFSAKSQDHCVLVGWGVGIYFFVITSRSILWHTQPPVQWVTRTLFPESIVLEHEVDQSPPSSAEVKNESTFTPSFPVCLHVIEFKDNFIFYLYLYFQTCEKYELLSGGV